jgi:hypothetical protein
VDLRSASAIVAFSKILVAARFLWGGTDALVLCSNTTLAIATALDITLSRGVWTWYRQLAVDWERYIAERVQGALGKLVDGVDFKHGRLACLPPTPDRILFMDESSTPTISSKRVHDTSPPMLLGFA